MLLRKADHIGIMVSDMDRSIEWYTRVLGLAVRLRVRLNEKTELAFLTLGDMEIELICKAAPFEYSETGIVNHLAFRVDDVAATLAHLKEHGVTLLNQEPVGAPSMGAQIAFFKGPDGEKFELVGRVGG